MTLLAALTLIGTPAFILLSWHSLAWWLGRKSAAHPKFWSLGIFKELIGS